LSWNGRKLFISEAPEPNGIDWNNIHAKTKDRIMVSHHNHPIGHHKILSLFCCLHAFHLPPALGHLYLENYHHELDQR
jgi:hypothetical protein